MISKKKLEGLDFSTVEEYYDYINESIINGQRQQAMSLVKDMSASQKRECLHYYHASGRSLETDEACKLIISSM